MTRKTPIEISKEDFKKIGHQLVDDVADFLDTIAERSVTKGETPEQIQKLLGSNTFPTDGKDPQALLDSVTDLLFNHSLFNGHAKFMGYITSSPAPIGVLAELLAATVNPNVGAHILSPMATEIEKQTIKWLADFIGDSKS